MVLSDAVSRKLLTSLGQAAEKSLEELKSLRVTEAQFGRGEKRSTKHRRPRRLPYSMTYRLTKGMI